MHFAILSEFLDNATIHGLGHISRSRSAFVKALWTAIVVACFAGAITMILNSYSYKEWQESPVSTTISTHPITELEFPAVTVCPPWQSNTALNHLLEKVKNVTLTKKKRQELLDIAEEVFIKIPNRRKGKQIVRLLSIGNMKSIVHGQYNLPEVEGQTEGDTQLINMHYTLELPENIEEEIGDNICLSLDSIAVSLFGNMTVEPREIHIITKEYQNKRSK